MYFESQTRKSNYSTTREEDDDEMNVRGNGSDHSCLCTRIWLSPLSEDFELDMNLSRPYLLKITWLLNFYFAISSPCF